MLLLLPGSPEEGDFAKVFITALLPPGAHFQHLSYYGVIVTLPDIEALELKAEKLLLVLELSYYVYHFIRLIYGSEKHLVNFVPKCVQEFSGLEVLTQGSLRDFQTF